MPEEMHRVKTYQIFMKCPNCEDGYMDPTGLALLSSPPQYPHKCDEDCGYKYTYNITYPYIAYLDDSETKWDDND